MNREVMYLPEIEKDLKQLDNTQRNLVIKAIEKVQQNPLPDYENGYGKSIGNHNSTKFADFLKIKLCSGGLRVIYQLLKTESTMLIVAADVRADEEVYESAGKRVDKYHLL